MKEILALLEQLLGKVSPAEIIALLSGQPITINVGPTEETFDIAGKTVKATEQGTVTLQIS